MRTNQGAISGTLVARWTMSNETPGARSMTCMPVMPSFQDGQIGVNTRHDAARPVGGGVHCGSILCPRLCSVVHDDVHRLWPQTAKSIAPPTAGGMPGLPRDQFARSPLPDTWKAPKMHRSDTSTHHRERWCALVQDALNVR